MNKNRSISPDSQYRALFENPKEKLITLAHLFDAVTDNGLGIYLQKLYIQKYPIKVLIEGSTFPRNINIVEKWLSGRNNPNDNVCLIDISLKSIKSHKDFVNNMKFKNVEVLVGDMNLIPLEDRTVDFVINDCTINFNRTDNDNRSTLKEIKRVLKNNPYSFSLLTAAVDRRYDNTVYGVDQELVSVNKLNSPGVFSSFKTKDDGSIELIKGTERKCWPVKYYEGLFKEIGLDYTKFDVQNGKTYFPEKSGISYRRYLLTK